MMTKKQLVMITAFVLILVPLSACGVERHSAEKSGDDGAWKAYQGTICLSIFSGHIVLPALGHGSACGHPTPNCNQAYCSACAAAKNVCAVCGMKNSWTRNTDPETELPLLFDILNYSDNLEARRVAIHAVAQIGQPGTLKMLMKYRKERELAMQLVSAVGSFGDESYIDYLEQVLSFAGDSYFGEEDENIDAQYYQSMSAKAAASSLVRVGNAKAMKILLNRALKGGLWERVFVLEALGSVEGEEERVKARQVLTESLHEFFKKENDWKWIPGRDLIGATLRSLARVGDEETAKHLVHYIRNPGCDFLYQDLRKCLAVLGEGSVEHISSALKEDLDNGLYDWGRSILVEALGDIGNPEAVNTLHELLDRTYPDEWRERDFKEKALDSLGKLKSEDSIEIMTRELLNAKNDTVRQAAVRALSSIGGREVFDILVRKLEKTDTSYINRECISGLNRIAFQQLNDDRLKLTSSRLTGKILGPEAAFEVTYPAVVNGEEWALSFFFENLSKVPMQRNYFRVIELISSGPPEVVEKVVRFLAELTGLDLALTADSPHEEKQAVNEKLRKWYQEHSKELK